MKAAVLTGPGRVDTAAQPNAGIILDTWHIARAHTPPGLLESLPAGLVVKVQLNDAGPVPFADLREEGRHHRLLPGEGRIELTELLRLLRRNGVQAPYSVEVLSDELDAHDPAETARRAYGATCRVLDAALGQGVSDGSLAAGRGRLVERPGAVAGSVLNRRTG